MCVLNERGLHVCDERERSGCEQEDCEDLVRCILILCSVSQVCLG